MLVYFYKNLLAIVLLKYNDRLQQQDYEYCVWDYTGTLNACSVFYNIKLKLIHGSPLACKHRIGTLCDSPENIFGRMLMSFPHSWLINGFMTRIAQRVLHVEQELITLTKHMSSLRFLVGFILLELQFSM